MLDRTRLQLAARFRCFDVDGSGELSKSEFVDGLLSLNALMPEPVTAAEIELLARHVDANGDGSISYEEFFDGFKLEDDALSTVLDRSAAAREGRRVGVNYRGEDHEHTVALESEPARPPTPKAGADGDGGGDGDGDGDGDGGGESGAAKAS